MNVHPVPPVVFLGDRFLTRGETPTVSLFDRGYLLGDSVFASTRVEQGQPFALSLHLARFVAAARGLDLEVPSVAALTSIVDQACERFGGEQGYLRITTSRGEGGVGLALAGATSPVLSVVVRELPNRPFPEPTAVGLATLRAAPAACFDPSWKVGSYAARVQMRREAEARGHREALVLGIGGELVSGIASNVFVVERGVFKTPPPAAGCRAGVTREVCMDLLARRGRRVVEAELFVEDVRRAEALFFTSALLPMLSASALDGAPFATDLPELTELRDALAAEVLRERSARRSGHEVVP